MSLEEFPPNREFWGRNFNAGECIQLVLKSPMTGLWLPFPFICRVMLHEMAHIKEMNHSRAFHAVRIGYHKAFDALVVRGYTGDGFWSTGNSLSEGYTAVRVLIEGELPDNLCGGTYRRAKKIGQKRKLTYGERQQIRKERLFGKGEGASLGGSEQARSNLEKGKGKGKKAVATKPRVAQSQRGRDLRAEAAMKRIEAQRVEMSTSTPTKEDEEDESDEDMYGDVDEDTVDVGGGHRLVKVEEGGKDQENWKEMLDDMNLLCATNSTGASGGSNTATKTPRVPRPEVSSTEAGTKAKNGIIKTKDSGSETEKLDIEPGLRDFPPPRANRALLVLPVRARTAPIGFYAKLARTFLTNVAQSTGYAHHRLAVAASIQIRLTLEYLGFVVNAARELPELSMQR
ncbi:MAG: hypothetical protein CYPHOPRED_005395 [Cyphobasidiales sp. Tagirdzhanova-0007]|nr:MAG: hypothetical protein CYPHOPRED_005395 [Cyphobasidiales sp. Tagirdzhanova-0007]